MLEVNHDRWTWSPKQKNTFLENNSAPIVHKIHLTSNKWAAFVEASTIPKPLCDLLQSVWKSNIKAFVWTLQAQKTCILLRPQVMAFSTTTRISHIPFLQFVSREQAVRADLLCNIQAVALLDILYISQKATATFNGMGISSQKSINTTKLGFSLLEE